MRRRPEASGAKVGLYLDFACVKPTHDMLDTGFRPFPKLLRPNQGRLQINHNLVNLMSPTEAYL